MNIPDNLVAGQKYKITYRNPAWRHSRCGVMAYIDRNILRRSTRWSARPVAGTQELPNHWVENIEEVPADTKPYLHRRVSS